MEEATEAVQLQPAAEAAAARRPTQYNLSCSLPVHCQTHAPAGKKQQQQQRQTAQAARAW